MIIRQGKKANQVNTLEKRIRLRNLAAGACEAILAVSLLFAAGCGKSIETPASSVAAPRPAPAADAYDTEGMDFKPGPATVSSERHTGVFASGSALNMDAVLKPTGPDAVKEIRRSAKWMGHRCTCSTAIAASRK